MAVEVRHDHGFGLEEVAAALDVSPATEGGHLVAAEEHLRAEFGIMNAVPRTPRSGGGPQA